MRAFLLLSLGALAGAVSPASLQKDGPQRGGQAPEHGLRSWIQTTDEPRELSQLRGRVVIVHTFAWNCSSCVKVGIPLAVDLLQVNKKRGLSVISVTTPAMRDSTKKVMQDMGMKHAVAVENPFKSTSPYIDVSKNAITYMFVIGRNGDVVWRGDPSSHLKECLAAVQHALNQEGGRQLARELDEKLSKAVAPYFAGDYGRARSTAKKLASRYGRSRKPKSVAIAADANYLIERIDSVGKMLGERLERAMKDKDLAGLLSAKDELERGFAKDELWKKLAPSVKAMMNDKALAADLERAAAWRELQMDRPPLYPLRRDKSSKRYASRLKKLIARYPDSSEAERASRLLDPFVSRQ